MQDSLETGLYLHVPFCAKKCPYCHFYKELWQQDAEDAYISSLIQEIMAYKKKFGALHIQTLFFGGGTPNMLKTASLERVIETICMHHYLKEGAEVTMEINPGLSSVKKLRAIKQLGVNRISIGTQSFNDDELVRLGRQHNSNSNRKCIEAVKAVGFERFSCDIIYGLPGSTIQTLTHSIKETLSFNPSHISTYALSIEPNTPYKRQGVVSAGDDDEIEQFETIVQLVSEKDIHQYEISNFAKRGYESKHNMRYWHSQPVIGLGPGAHSYFKNARYKNARSLSQYISDPAPSVFSNKKWPSLSRKATFEHFLLCRFRLLEPILLSDLESACHGDFKKTYGPQLEQLLALDLIELTEQTVSISAKGRYMLNSIIELFL